MSGRTTPEDTNRKWAHIHPAVKSLSCLRFCIIAKVPVDRMPATCLQCGSDYTSAMRRPFCKASCARKWKRGRFAQGKRPDWREFLTNSNEAAQ
jgi:hypothetical protein